MSREPHKSPGSGRIEAAGDPWLPVPLTVTGVVRETADTATLTLDASAQPCRFRPGQFNMLYLLGLGEAAISISGDPARPGELVHTVRGVGSVTSPLIALEAGAAVGVRGPFGSSWPLEAAAGSDVVVVAGGIGLAPLRPAVYELMRHRDRYNRVVILYGARSPADMLYMDELRGWRGRFDADVRVTVDSAPADWRAPVGVVTRLIEKTHFDPDDTVVMTCGPEVMMHFVVHEFLKEGVPAENVWMSMERNMRCAVGLCGHCQWGPKFVCRDGPVFRYDRVRSLFGHREI